MARSIIRSIIPELTSLEIHRIALGCALAGLLVAAPTFAQVLTIDTSGRPVAPGNAPVDRQYEQIQPTHVALSNTPMGTRDKWQIVRDMQSVQGFAMRPLPGGHKGLTLEANGKLDPAGVPYLNMVIANGISAKPGSRVVITDIKIDHNKLIFDLNDGPDGKHRFLRHVSIGADPNYDAPVVADTATATGSRITLVFKGHIPDLTGDQLKALLAPLITFDVKTPVQAFTDTLPKPLKEAILGHQVLVGMSTDMVIFAKGQPQTKYHTMDGQMPVDIWLYGEAPQPVTFVRINGNRVIRVEIAKVGVPIEVFTQDVVSEMMTASGQPTVEQAENVHVIREGDVERDPDEEAPAAPPTLRNAGETLPTDNNKNAQVMRPVYFPKAQPDPDQPNASSTGTSSGSQQAGSTANGQSSGATQASKQGTTPAGSSAGGAQTAKPAAPAQPAQIGADPDDQPN